MLQTVAKGVLKLLPTILGVSVTGANVVTDGVITQVSTIDTMEMAAATAVVAVIQFFKLWNDKRKK